MTGFTGTFTATQVTQVRRGDRVQWVADTATVVGVGFEAKGVTLLLILPTRQRPAQVTLSVDTVLFVQQ